MTALLPAAKDLGLAVIEDAAEALGSMHPEGPAGSFGVAAALSFNGNKVMTTGGGGAFVTDDAEMAAAVRYLSTQARDPVQHYEHRAIGFNYRLSNVLAAIGIGQLTRLDQMIERRREIRRRYAAIFAEVHGTRLLGGPDPYADNCWLSVLVVDEAAVGWTAAELIRHLDSDGIESRPVWKPMHSQPVHRGRATAAHGDRGRPFHSWDRAPRRVRPRRRYGESDHGLCGDIRSWCPMSVAAAPTLRRGPDRARHWGHGFIRLDNG